MRFLYGEPAFVLRAKRVLDPYSGETEALDWTDVERIGPYEWCALAPRKTDEPAVSGERPVVIEATVYSPHPDMDLTAQDRIEIAGQVWDIDGEPLLWRNPLSGWTPGWQIDVKRRVG